MISIWGWNLHHMNHFEGYFTSRLQEEPREKTQADLHFESIITLYMFIIQHLPLSSLQRSAKGYIPKFMLTWSLGIWSCLQRRYLKVFRILWKSHPGLGAFPNSKALDPERRGEATAKHKGKKVMWRLKSQVKQRSFGATRKTEKISPCSLQREQGPADIWIFTFLVSRNFCFFKSFIFPPFLCFSWQSQKTVQTWGMHLLPSQLWKGRNNGNVCFPHLAFVSALCYYTT